MTESSYSKFLENRHFLYRPWIPVMKTMEAENLLRMDFTAPALDLGCGDGVFSASSFRGKIELGIDIDLVSLKKSRESGVYKAVLASDAGVLPFDNECFRSVVSICAMEHMNNIEGVLGEISRILIPGGKLIFSVPSVYFAEMLFASRFLRAFGFRSAATIYGEKKNQRAGHLNIFSIETWGDLIKSSGMELTSHFYVAPPSVVLLWSFMTSAIFKTIFLPFRLVRSLNIKPVDELLRFLLGGLSGWLKARSVPTDEPGGYVFIIAERVK